MRRYLFALALTAAIGASSTTVRAALTFFPSGLWRKPEPSQEWVAVAVDYDLQHVTIMQEICEFPPVTCSDRTGRMECTSWYTWGGIMQGMSDSATTFGLT